jgi:excinuclease ABC subunit A
VKRILDTLEATGLGYIHIGQPATTLSGGEAQRIKLASELSRRSTGRTLYILDEPTTGLSFQDVAHLLHVLQRLADAGNTVLVIEHHLDVIKAADHVIDLGPLGGDRGGELIAWGTPEEVALEPRSFTGQYLKPILEAAGTLDAAAAPKRGAAHRAPEAVEVDGRKITSRTRKAAVAPAPTPANGRAPKREPVTAGAAANEQATAKAAARIDARVTREATPEQPRPETKAAAKRRRQAENPRKETASERDLREMREARQPKG